MKTIYLSLSTALLSFLGYGQGGDVVISQFFGGNGTTNLFNQDFVEIFNRSSAPVNISGWTLQYGSSTGNYTVSYTFPANTTINDGKYYLIGLATATGGTSIPTPDGTAATNISASSGKLALVKNNTALGATNPSGNVNVSDYVGYGTANYYETSVLTGMSASAAAKRNSNGCIDSNNNSTDFTVVTSTTVRNNSSTANICTTNPSIAITSPINNAVYSPETTSVNLSFSVGNFNVANGTGDGHIHYTVNGGTVIMKYDTSTVNLTTSPGTYIIYAELVDNTHTPLSPPQNTTIIFNVANYTAVTDLAALRADVVANGYGKYYAVQSMPIASYTRTTRNQKYVQDSSGGILIDDNTGVLNGLALAESEAIIGLKGQSVNFSNVLQINPTTAAGVTKSSASPVVPQNISIATFMLNPEDYESELINLGSISFGATDIGTNYTVNTNYTINQGADTTIFRTGFNEADYLGTVIPSTVNLTAIGSDFTTSDQVLVRRLADMTTLASDHFDNNKNLKIYPIPAREVLYITSDTSNVKTIEIYNLLGAKIFEKQVIDNNINISSINKGMYLIKITEENKTVIKQLLID